MSTNANNTIQVGDLIEAWLTVGDKREPAGNLIVWPCNGNPMFQTTASTRDRYRVPALVLKRYEKNNDRGGYSLLVKGEVVYVLFSPSRHWKLWKDECD